MNTSPLTYISRLFSPISKKETKNKITKHADISPRIRSKSFDTYSLRNVYSSKKGFCLLGLLEHPVYGPMFEQYAKIKHADEGILFLNDFFELDEKSDTHSCAKKLIEKYFLNNSEFNINLKADNLNKLLSVYESGKYTLFSLFEDVIAEVFDDIKNSDTLRNFIADNVDVKNCVDNIDIHILYNWLTIKTMRHALKNCDFDNMNSIKLCISIKTCILTENFRHKKINVNKIISVYLETGSNFYVIVPKIYLNLLRNVCDNSVLYDLEYEILMKLSKDEKLMTYVRKEYSSQ